jgi:hypothetical protein
MNVLAMTRKPVAATLIVAMTAVSVPLAPSHAAMVGTDRLIDQMGQSPRDRLSVFLARQDVRAQLAELGVSPKEAEARIASLSDQEVEAIAGRIDTLPAGQGAVEAIVGAAVLVFIVLLITDLLGLTHLFGFTNKGSLRSR